MLFLFFFVRLKIDGHSVKMVDRNRAFEEQYGGDEEVDLQAVL